MREPLSVSSTRAILRASKWDTKRGRFLCPRGSFRYRIGGERHAMETHGLPPYAHEVYCHVAEVEEAGVRRRLSLKMEVTIGEPPRPKILYTYLKSEYALADILNMRLKTSDAVKTNDAFEFAWKIVPSNIINAGFKHSKDERILEYQREYADILKFVCFSDSSVNDLLWAHYADVHKGVCFGIELDLIIDNENAVYPVHYDGPVENDIRTHKSEQECLDLFKRVLCTKEPPWAGEREWRAIIKRDHQRIASGIDGNTYFKLYPNELRQVVFGMHCPPEEIGRIGLACCHKRISVEYFKIKPNYGNHRLVAKPIQKSEMNECMNLALLAGRTVFDAN